MQTRLIRVSAIGRIRSDATHEAVKAFAASKLREKGLRASDLKWLQVPSGSGEKRYAQFSMVIPADALDDAWNLRASRSFADAGYGDVTWKITPVNPNDPDGGQTTGPIPREPVPGWRQADEAHTRSRDAGPPEPFGSERFWEWFEGRDEFHD